jgi:hypothetical protein
LEDAETGATDDSEDAAVATTTVAKETMTNCILNIIETIVTKFQKMNFKD